MRCGWDLERTRIFAKITEGHEKMPFGFVFAGISQDHKFIPRI